MSDNDYGDVDVDNNAEDVERRRLVAPNSLHSHLLKSLLDSYAYTSPPDTHPSTRLTFPTAAPRHCSGTAMTTGAPGESGGKAEVTAHFAATKNNSAISA